MEPDSEEDFVRTIVKDEVDGVDVRTAQHQAAERNDTAAFHALLQ